MSGNNFVNLSNSNGRKAAAGAAKSLVPAIFMLTLFTLFLMPQQTAWAGTVTCDQTNLTAPAERDPAPGPGEIQEVLSFETYCSKSGGGQSTAGVLTEVTVTNSGTAALSSCTIYDDTGTTLGSYEGTETTVGNLTGDAPYYFTGLTKDLGVNGVTTDFLVVVTVDSGATNGQTFTCTIAGSGSGLTITADVVNYAASDNVSNLMTVYVPSVDDVTVTDYNGSLTESATVSRSTKYAMFGFNLASTDGVADLADVWVYSSGGTAVAADIQSIELRIDDGGTTGKYDATDTLVGAMTWSTDHYQMSANPSGETIPTSPGTNYIVVVEVAAGATSGNTFEFNFNADDKVVIDSPDTINTFGVMTGATHTVAADTVTVTDYNPTLTEPATVAKSTKYAMFGFNLTSSLGVADLADAWVYSSGGTAVAADITSIELRIDDGGTTGKYDVTDSLVGAMSWSTDHYQLSANPSGETIPTSPGTNYIVVVEVAAGATSGNTFEFNFNASDKVTVDGTADQVSAFSSMTGDTHTVAADTVTATDYNGSLTESATVSRSTKYAMFGFNLTSAEGSADLADVWVYSSGGTAVAADIASIELRIDDGGTTGKYDVTDTLVGAMTWSTDHYQMSANPSGETIPTSPGTNYIVVVEVAAGATSGNTFEFNFNADDKVVIDSPDSINTFGVMTGATHTIAADTVTVTDYNPSLTESATVSRSTKYAMFGFNLTSSLGVADLADAWVYSSGGTAVAADIQSIELRIDDGGTGGKYDAGDTLVGAMSWSTDHYQMSANPSSETIPTSPGTNYIVVVEVAAGAISGNTFEFNFNASDKVTVDGTADQVSAFSSMTGATHTVAADTVTVTDYNPSLTEPADVSLSTKYAMFGFNLTSSLGVADLADAWVYSSGGTAVAADIQSIELRIDDGGTSGKYDASDTLVGAMSWSTDHYQMSANPSGETIPTSPGTNYIVVVEVAAGATGGNTFEFNFNASDKVTVDGTADQVSAFGAMTGDTHTVVVGPPDRLKAFDSLQIGATNIFRGDRNVPILQFSVLTSSGSGGNDSITISEVYLNFYDMGSGVIDSFVSSNMMKFYQDNSPLGTFDNTDVYKGIFACDSATCTLNNLTENVGLSSSYYLVTGNTTSTPIYSSFSVGLNAGGGFAVGGDELATNHPLGITSGNITQDFDRKMGVGWNLITASSADTTVNYNLVFSDDTAPYKPYMIEWDNAVVDSSWNCSGCQWSSTIQNDTLMNWGKGYFLYAEENDQILSTNGGSYAPGEQTVSLDEGANIVGNPFDYILPMDAASGAGVYITDGGTTHNLKVASEQSPPWIEADVFWYNGNTYEAVNVDSAVDSYNNMVPWRGYWIRLLKTGGGYSIKFTP
jgi:hypothetical protein